ncbi:tRNA pseudouridine(38-40) synthase TruA [Alkalicoccus chagannorensis]|uniref:tRNA pseudouridine(38-40) synthase TruA n=1 Tax=Alkalicoccus chagannorensis TaxID=427072 RepID=UPI00041CDACC|nr:tRNA pseudouridine(38-40) synthase TruA [Alkalicoccus chagannorensis]
MRIMIYLSYDGSGFRGYQKQPDARTVQQEVERALARMHKADSWPSTASGRTDTGVHALSQPVHFDTPLQIPLERWPRALNGLLPDDIYVHRAVEAEGLHARYDTVGKEYVYRMTTGAPHDVFQRHYRLQLRETPDAARMRQAAAHWLGRHDFSSLSSPRTDVADKVRTMYAVDIYQDGTSWVLRFAGSGFLYQMVRIMTGTLLAVGFGEWKPEDMPALMEAKDRTQAPKTAPGHGLYLSRVFYDSSELEQHLQQRPDL